MKIYVGDDQADSAARQVACLRRTSSKRKVHVRTESATRHVALIGRPIAGVIDLDRFVGTCGFDAFLRNRRRGRPVRQQRSLQHRRHRHADRHTCAIRQQTHIKLSQFLIWPLPLSLCGKRKYYIRLPNSTLGPGPARGNSPATGRVVGERWIAALAQVAYWHVATR